MAEIIERIGRGGKKSYLVRFVDTDGKRKMRATHQSNRRDAERFAAEIESRKGKGMVGIVEPTPEERARATGTLAALVERFRSDSRPPKLKDANRYHIDAASVFKRRILPFRVAGSGPTLGDRAAAAVTALDVERLR